MADHQRIYASPHKRNMGSILGAGYDPSQDLINRCEVVGYVLGKVEQRVIPLQERQRRTTTKTTWRTWCVVLFSSSSFLLPLCLLLNLRFSSVCFAPYAMWYLMVFDSLLRAWYSFVR
jgi:hypothetical protein